MENRLIFLCHFRFVEARGDGEGQTSQVMDVLVQARRRGSYDNKANPFNAEK